MWVGSRPRDRKPYRPWDRPLARVPFDLHLRTVLSFRSAWNVYAIYTSKRYGHNITKLLQPRYGASIRCFTARGDYVPVLYGCIPYMPIIQFPSPTLWIRPSKKTFWPTRIQNRNLMLRLHLNVFIPTGSNDKRLVVTVQFLYCASNL